MNDPNNESAAALTREQLDGYRRALLAPPHAGHDTYYQIAHRLLTELERQPPTAPHTAVHRYHLTHDHDALRLWCDDCTADSECALGTWYGNPDPLSAILAAAHAHEREHHGAHEREHLVHDEPDLAEQVRRGIAEAESGGTVYLGSFAQHGDAHSGQASPDA